MPKQTAIRLVVNLWMSLSVAIALDLKQISNRLALELTVGLSGLRGLPDSPGNPRHRLNQGECDANLNQRSGLITCEWLEQDQQTEYVCAVQNLLNGRTAANADRINWLYYQLDNFYVDSRCSTAVFRPRLLSIDAKVTDRHMTLAISQQNASVELMSMK